jgi:uncharacterized protein YgiM (DUF1202 family)
MLKVAGGIILAVVILAVIVPVSCSMCAVGTVVAVDEHEKQQKEEKKAETRAASPIGESVTYNQTCNVRSKPKIGARRIGKATAGTPYTVLEKKGKWRKIDIGSGIGWAGCTSTE